ncbi:hypothetical protein D9611_001843 [Ephemerocybe angulata]|uniref:Ubiquitin-like protease family profile domain-containing protein n=1 Tax=Ephemerocybe angulata TaxID=980116 RepID=A0A8H5FLP5_9AGAR|nr:hypothetical protein D9611_001843 [Tulosesus angulatus]
MLHEAQTVTSLLQWNPPAPSNNASRSQKDQNRIDMLIGAQTLWKTAVAHMKALSEVDGDGKEVTEAVLELLDQVRWEDKLNGFSRNGVAAVAALPVFASKNWLKDDHINLALDLLRDNLDEKRALNNAVLQPTWFIKIVVNAYEDVKAYTDDKKLRWLRQLGHGMALKGGFSCLASIMNVAESHWTAVVVNPRAKTIEYGDSFGCEMPKNMMDALQWWTGFHTGKEFDVVPLPVGKQTDSYSCGVFAYNAIAVRLLPELHELATDETVAIKRVQILQRALETHVDNPQLGTVAAVDDEDGAESSDSDSSDKPESDSDDSDTNSLATKPDIDDEPEPSQTPAPSNTRPLERKSSSIRAALELSDDVEDDGKKRGILNFFKKATPEERELQKAREIEKLKRTQETAEYEKAMDVAAKKKRAQELARARKANERKRKKLTEIQAGLRSPGGTKRKIKELNLTDTNVKRFRGMNSVAELSRPARQIQKKIKEETKKPQGRKKKNGDESIRPAKYTNWFTPFRVRSDTKPRSRSRFDAGGNVTNMAGGLFEKEIPTAQASFRARLIAAKPHILASP